MKVVKTSIQGCLILEPQVFSDERGHFFESFSLQRFRNATGVQGKLVRVVSGKVWDVAVDLRRSSPTFAQWFGVELSEENQRMLWVPPGCAHGFVVTGDHAVFLYKTTDYYAPAHERTIVWNDPSLAITWPVETPIMNAKDAAGASFKQSPSFK